MKVVIFCGGLGLRIRDVSEKIPKPLIPIGRQPILWHIMKYYAHYGHKDFILCLGYRGDLIKRFFLDYDARLTNDFVFTPGRQGEVLPSDMGDWRIQFVETGLDNSIGERLRRVRPLLDGEEYFLANYSDSLTDAPINSWVDSFKARDKIASFLCVHPHLSLHHVTLDEDNTLVKAVSSIRSTLRINGGYFVLRSDIFDYMKPGEELVEEPFERLIRKRALIGQVHDGYWGTMDTFKDHQVLEQLNASGEAPWQVWDAPDPEAVVVRRA